MRSKAFKRGKYDQTIHIFVSLTRIPPDACSFCTNQLGFKPFIDKIIISSKHPNQEAERYLGETTFTISF